VGQSLEQSPLPQSLSVFVRDLSDVAHARAQGEALLH